jgi:hypothetical protein
MSGGRSINGLVVLALFNGYMIAKMPLIGLLLLLITANYRDSLQNEIYGVDTHPISKAIGIGILSVFLIFAITVLFNYAAYSTAN